MQTSTQDSMRAVAIDRFGGLDTLQERSVPRPTPGAGDVLVHVEVAGVGEWDPFEREGGFAEMTGQTPKFPYVLGSEGAGTVAAVGPGVDRFEVGDRVYAAGFINPKGGFYAEYAAVAQDLVSPVPGQLTTEQAAVMGGVGVTALRGLDDVLELQSGESIIIVGASGGVGHVAVQLAKRMGARVLAVASGEDGVELVTRLGADAAIDGRHGDVRAAAKAFAPEGADAALIVAGGRVAEEALSALREGGRGAFPDGVEPAPNPRGGIRLDRFDGHADADILDRLNRAIEEGHFEVLVSQVFPLDEAAAAHRAVGHHHLGKLALRV